MRDIRLYIITDNPDIASIDCFALDEILAPRWAKFVTDHAGLIAIPNRARVHTCWTKPERSLLEQLFLEERAKAGREFRRDWDETTTMLKDWRDRRRPAATITEAPTTPTADLAAPVLNSTTETRRSQWT